MPKLSRGAASRGPSLRSPAREISQLDQLCVCVCAPVCLSVCASACAKADRGLGSRFACLIRRRLRDRLIGFRVRSSPSQDGTWGKKWLPVGVFNYLFCQKRSQCLSVGACVRACLDCCARESACHCQLQVARQANGIA